MRFCAILLTFVSLLSAAGPAVVRDWTKNPAVIQIDTTADVFAVGDAHSDFEHLVRALDAAGIVAGRPERPEQARWRAGRAVLVSTGDMVDKGPRALDVLRLYQTLRAQAESAGGDVVILAGNHEAEFLADPAAAKGAEFARQLKAAGISPADVAACKGEVGSFLCSLAFAARVNDWFFSHAGRSSGRTLPQIAADLRAGVEKDGFRTRELIGQDSPLEGRPSKEGKQWFDSGMPAQDEKQLLTNWARALGVTHIVQGHEPSDIFFADGVKRNHGEMFQRFGVIFFIDTGMSEGVADSDGAVLHIAKNGQEAIAVCPDGVQTPLWDARSNPDTGRAAACGGVRTAVKAARGTVTPSPPVAHPNP
jgi:hypothetical protein